MAGFNKIVLLGNLTKDPELKYTAGGKALCKFGLGVNRKFKRQDGSYGDEVLFVGCTAWGRTGENVAEHLKKGSQVLVEGRLMFSTWQDKNTGNKRSKHEVNVDTVQFLGRPKGQQGEGAPAGQQAPPTQSSEEGPPPSDDDVPF